jgi:hypothetical protein
MKVRIAVSVLALSVAACGAEQRPVKVAGPPPVDASARVTNALAGEGHVPDRNRSNDALVVTEWRDTGFKWGMIDNESATLVRRFLVAIGKEDITVRADVKKCAGGFIVEGEVVRGRCENVNAVPQQIQDEVDSVGAKV